MAYFLDSKDRFMLVHIFSKWRSENKVSYALPGYWVSILISLTMIPFDSLFFPKTNVFYLPYRLGMIVFFIAVGFTGKIIEKKDQKHIPETLKSFYMLGMPFMWSVLYLYFLYHSYTSIDPIESRIVLFGNIMVAIFPMIFIFQFWKEIIAFQLFNLTAIISGISLKLITTQNGIDFIDGLLLIVAHMCSFFFCFIMRRNFASDLYNRYLNVLKFVPANISDEIVASGHDQDIGKKYIPENRFTICLCSDWRNSQNLSESLRGENITKTLETYYDVVFDKLAELVPDKKYYASWYADELLIFFFGDKSENDKEIAIKNCFNFLQYFAFEISDDLEQKIGFKINFDIGISCGMDLLGLQGPKSNKKTTLIGKSPGVAKRNESEAKALRYSHFNGNGPIIVFQEEFITLAKDTINLRNYSLVEMTAQGKNIKGKKIFVLNTSKQTSEPYLKKAA